jgi:hypothetical protein
MPSLLAPARPIGMIEPGAVRFDNRMCHEGGGRYRGTRVA